MKPIYSLQDIRDYVSKHPSIISKPEEIFLFWESKNWKTLKGTLVSSLSAAVASANGALNYSKNKDLYISKQKEFKSKYLKVAKDNKQPKAFEQYTDQLHQPEWEAFRQFIFVVRKRKCELCGSKVHLQVHHLHYIKDRKAWEYLPSDVMVLCHKCHKSAHNIK